MSASTVASQKRSLVSRAVGLFLFVLAFLRALVLANLQLAKTILFVKREDLSPGFVTYPVEHLSKLEILVLSHCITLTPGTTTVEVSADFKTLTLHALDARDPEGTVKSIQDELERPILRWTR